MSNFETAGDTHTGQVRENNEDSFVICNSSVVLAAVADGIGGHVHGEVASKMCCTELAEKFWQSGMDDSWNPERAAEVLRCWTEEVNSSIFRRNREEMNLLPMGTTLCAAIFFPDFIVSANAGDSRLYALEDKKIKALTRDHVVCHNGGQYLSRAVGVAVRANAEVKIISGNSADKFVVVSDGVYNSMTENDIALILNNSSDAVGAVKNIISRANLCGGVDNLTAAVIFRRNK